MHSDSIRIEDLYNLATEDVHIRQRVFSYLLRFGRKGEAVIFTEEDDETEAQIWERKKQSRNNQHNTEAVIHKKAISESVVDENTNFTQRLRMTNQILSEQSKDPILQQLKAKIQNEEHSEEMLLQDYRYKHYLNNLD